MIGVLTCGCTAYAQHGISMTYAPSQVIKHRADLLFDVPPYAQELRLTYSYETKEQSEWARYWKLPRVNINTVLVDFGDREVLGRAYAFLPELQFDVVGSGKLRGQIYFGTGIAYLDRPYNAINNLKNNAIGSHLNNITSLKIGGEYRWSDRVTTALSVGLVHFSNGLSSSPNAGINTYGLGVSANYLLGRADEIAQPVIQPRQPANDEPEDTSTFDYRRWIGEIQYQYGFTEFTVPDGPKYGVQALSVAAGYRYRKFLTAYLGAEYEYNDRTYLFHRNLFESEEESKRKARRSMVYLEHELRFGPVFNRLRLGFYLGWPADLTKTNYVKISTGIYLPKVPYLGRPFVAVVLKTHAAVADYLGVAAGISF